MMNSQVVISHDALVHNATMLRNKIGDFYCVLKCDAYGHGAKKCAKLLCDLGFRHFAVYSFTEALEIKNIISNADILIFGRTPLKYADVLIENHFIQNVFSEEYAREISYNSKGLRAHVKLDTGMNRSGFKCGAEQIKNVFSAFAGEIEGVYTHFHSADCAELTQTKKELEDFINRADELEVALGKKLLKHTAASAAALRVPAARLDLSRIGVALYGVLPDNCEGLCTLKPVMSFEAPVIAVRYLKKGENVGYGCDHRVQRDAVVATVSAGYANGLSRILADKFKPLLNGKQVNFSGRICMDRCMLDVTELVDSGISVKPYDTVQFFGDRVSVTEFAKCEKTIPYESLTRVGNMNGK